jgi:hypothetical protein
MCQTFCKHPVLFFTKSFESVHQHAAYITEHGDASPWTLSAEAWIKCGSDVGHVGFQFIQVAWAPVAGIVSGEGRGRNPFEIIQSSDKRERTFQYIHIPCLPRLFHKNTHHKCCW